MLFDDFFCYGHSESGSACALGRVERLKDFVPEFGFDPVPVVSNRDKGHVSIVVDPESDLDFSGLFGSGVDGVSEHVEQCVMNAVGVHVESWSRIVQFAGQVDFLFLGPGTGQLGGVLNDSCEARRGAIGLTILAESEHVQREGKNAFQVPLDDFPALFGDLDIIGFETLADDVCTAAKALKDILDVMGEVCDGFSGGCESFGAKLGLIESGVLDGQSRLVSDGGEQGEVFGGVGDVGDGGIDVYDAEDLVVCTNRGANGGTYAVVMDALSTGESFVPHGV